MKKWRWLWWLVGLAGVGTLGYFVLRPSSARALAMPTACGPCTLPQGGGFTQGDAQALCAAVAQVQAAGASQPGVCHHDIVETINYYAANHAADGSVVYTKDGASHAFPSFAAFLAAAMQG